MQVSILLFILLCLTGLVNSACVHDHFVRNATMNFYNDLTNDSFESGRRLQTSTGMGKYIGL